MGYEVDFLAVGSGEKSGDAIALRYGTLTGPTLDQRVVVIDGGFQESGEELVEHVKKHYKTTQVDLVISTHPDADHIAGLVPVIEDLTVRELWMHLPWKHSQDFSKAYSMGRVSEATFRAKLKKSLDDAVDLEALARDKGIPVTEPFAGTSFDGGRLLVVGPSESYYTSLLGGFRGSPLAESVKQLLGPAARLVSRVAEKWGSETLTDSGETSPENNSSVISLFRPDDAHLLFTADAGVPALSEALDYLDRNGYDYRKALEIVQVPHHGSRRNVGPTILDRLLGPPKLEGTEDRLAIVSAAKDGKPKHPSKKVLNAFKRRGAPVYGTEGVSKRRSRGAPERADWSACECHPFYDEVDE